MSPRTVPAEEAMRKEGASRKNGVHAKKPKPWKPASWYVQQILDRKDEPWVHLMLGQTEIYRTRPGGLVIVMGPSGGGKSSLTLGLMLNHARHHGPAIYLSAELPGDELVGRGIGMQTDSSWEDVLRGRVREEFMRDAMDLPRLVILEQEQATIENLRLTIVDMRAMCRGEPILFAADYTQIMTGGGENIRSNIADVMRDLNRVSRDGRVVGLAVNQMSRANSKIARSGEALGMETAEMAAESAAIERWATGTLAIGGLKAVNDQGDMVGQLSRGKGRMGGGDSVLPILFEGRTGRVVVQGEARPAAEVKAELETKRTDAKMEGASMAILGAAGKATEPLSRSDLLMAARVHRNIGFGAIVRLIQTGDLVEVRRKKAGTRGWLVCTPNMAREAQLPLLVEGPS